MSDISFEIRKAYKTALAGIITVHDQLQTGDVQLYAIVQNQAGEQISTKTKYMSSQTVTVTVFYRQNQSVSREQVEDITGQIRQAIVGQSLSLSGYIMHTSTLQAETSGATTGNERTYSTKSLTFGHIIESIS